MIKEKDGMSILENISLGSKKMDLENLRFLGEMESDPIGEYKKYFDYELDVEKRISFIIKIYAQRQEIFIYCRGREKRSEREWRENQLATEKLYVAARNDILKIGTILEEKLEKELLKNKNTRLLKITGNIRIINNVYKNDQ